MKNISCYSLSFNTVMPLVSESRSIIYYISELKCLSRIDTLSGEPKLAILFSSLLKRGQL